MTIGVSLLMCATCTKFQPLPLVANWTGYARSLNGKQPSASQKAMIMSARLKLERNNAFTLSFRSNSSIIKGKWSYSKVDLNLFIETVDGVSAKNVPHTKDTSFVWRFRVVHAEGTTYLINRDNRLGTLSFSRQE